MIWFRRHIRVPRPTPTHPHPHTMHCSYHLLLYLHFPLILTLSEQHPFIITKDKPCHIISFGDSYTDTSFDPTTPPLPCVSCPLGSPSCLVGDCYTGGHNWLTALTTLSNRTLTVTHNFARSGDVVDSALVTRKSIKSRQLPQMKEVWERRSEDVLWSFFIGINDIGATFDSGKHPDDPAFLDKVYSSYFEIIEELYWDYSARTFLLLNVPDTTRTPYYLAVLNEEERRCVHTAVVGANERLGEKAREFIGSHEGVSEVFPLPYVSVTYVV